MDYKKEQLTQLQTYFSLMESNGISYVYKISKECGLFDELSKSKQTSKDLSQNLDLLEHPTEILCQTLKSLNLVTQDEESFQYELSETMKFLQGSYQNLSSEYWEHFPDYLKKGTPFKRMDQLEDSEKEYQTQVKALEWMMAPSAQLASQHLREFGLNTQSKIIDIGCGAAVWSLAILEQNPNSHATLVDWPTVLKVAKQSASEKNLNQRIKTLEGNYHQLDFEEKNYDVAILGNVTHIETHQGCKKLFQKINKTLNKKGVLVIHDVYGKDPRGEMARHLYRLGLAVRTVEGKVHTPEEMTPWLKEAGFKRFEFKSLEVTPYSMGSFYAFKS